MGTLTVRENLMFSARLRLPSSMPIEEKRARVEQTLHELGLDAVADSLVGTSLLRGISGGERKRLSIGMEMITAPQILFLDGMIHGGRVCGASSSRSCRRVREREREGEGGRWRCVVALICHVPPCRTTLVPLCLSDFKNRPPGSMRPRRAA